MRHMCLRMVTLCAILHTHLAKCPHCHTVTLSYCAVHAFGKVRVMPPTAPHPHTHTRSTRGLHPTPFTPTMRVTPALPPPHHPTEP